MVIEAIGRRPSVGPLRGGRIGDLEVHRGLPLAWTYYEVVAATLYLGSRTIAPAGIASGVSRDRALILRRTAD